MWAYIAKKLAKEMSKLMVNSPRTPHRVKEKFLTSFASTSKQKTKSNLQERKNKHGDLPHLLLSQ